MNMGMIKAALLSRSAVPPQYQRVEYIESSNQQYIRIENILSDESRIEIDCEWDLNNSDSWCCLFGSGSALFNVQRIYNTSQIAFNFKNYGSNRETVSSNVRSIFVLDSKNKTAYVDSLNGRIDFYLSTAGSNNITGSLYLLKKREESFYSKAKLYGVKLYNSGISANLIPCRRKSDNKPGMWDTVSKSFFTNSSTGSDFTLGPDVI